MRNKKIAFFVNALRGGGAERILLTLANECAARGVDTELILGRALGPYMKDIRHPLKIMELGTNNPALGIIRLASYLKNHKPDTLLSTNMICNLASIFCNKIAGSPTRVIIREGSHMTSYWKNPSIHPYFMRAAHKFAPALYKKADEVIAVSKAVADDLVESYHVPRRKIHVMYSPLITENLLRLSEEATDHKWLNDDIPVILGAGRLSAEKDFKTLIKAVHEVRKTHNVRLIILGDGPLHYELNQLIHDLEMSDYVDMPGFVRNPYAFMRRASVFVLSSTSDALPGVLIQAMACDCPVVSTDAPGGASEILNDGKYGRLTTTGDSHTMAEAILRTLSEEKKPIDNSWLKQFTCEVAIKKYFTLLEID